MSDKVRDLRLEVLSLALVLAAACFLSSGTRSKSRWLSWLLPGRGSIENIYQLLPILQKNARALFLVFNDLASAINSVAAPHNGESRLPKDSVRVLLSQEWVQDKLRSAQDAVLSEFNLDAYTLDEAINRYRNDDQVQTYINGVELMYNIVLDGGYPQCPGVEICEGVTKQVALSVVEKVIVAKRDLLRASRGKVAASDSVEVEVVHREMERFGYANPVDAFIAFKNTENCYQYDFDFVQAKQRLYLKYGQVLPAGDPDPEVQRVSAEELRIMLQTLEAGAPLFLVIFDGGGPQAEFMAAVKRRAESEPKAVLVWMLRGESAPEYPCTSYPAAIRFRDGALEEIMYEAGLSSTGV